MSLSHAAIEGVLLSHGMSYEEINRALAPAPQIIRTEDDVLHGDPDTIVVDSEGDTWSLHDARTNLGTIWAANYAALPAVVVATGEHVRACREAIERDT